MTSALAFKARVDFSLARFLACALVLRFTSGATPADCIEASKADEPFLFTYLKAAETVH